MSINPRWPDFQLASRLRQLIGSQSSVPEGISTDTSSSSSSSSSLVGKPQREEDYIDDSQDLGFDDRLATMSDMGDEQVGAVEDLDNLSHNEAGDDGDDADFGELEMFDSNASPDIYSQVSQLVTLDEPSIPESGSALKRDKKKKKKEKALAAAERAELEASSKKRKRSKKKSLLESEIEMEDDQLPNVEEPVTSASLQHAAGIEGAVSDMRVHDSSPQKSKKRKLSDSAEGKHRKKKKSQDHASEDIIEATQEVELFESKPDSRAGHAGFLRTNPNGLVDSQGASDDDEDRNYNSQLSPSVARARRRSISAGPQSDSFKAAVAPMAPMAVDGLPGSRTTEAADTEEAYLPGSPQSRADADVEELAREAWREHIGTQNESDEDAPSPNGANDEHENAEEPMHEEETNENPRSRRTIKGKQPRPDDDVSGEATAVESPTGADINASQDTPRRKSRGKVAVKKSQGRPPSKENTTPSAAKSRTPKSKSNARIRDDEEAETPVRDKVDGFVQGRFTDDELGRLHLAVEKFRDELGLTQFEMNEMIQAPGGTSAGDTHAELWLRLTAECPDRKRQKVINVTRKNFHNFVARGTWTSEQDQELTDLIKVHGTAWSKIAAIINRHPEDVRDRYRNYIVCGSAQKRDVWDLEEETRLIKHIQDAIVNIDELRNDDDADAALKNKSYEELIDWQHISELMGRTRSRLQCITKWKLICKRLVEPAGRRGEGSAEKEARAMAKLEDARRQLTAMDDAECYRLVLAIDRAAGPLAKQVSWKQLTDQGLSSIWTRPSQLLFWHRLKQFVPEAGKKPVKEISQHIISFYNQTGSMPDLHQTTSDEQEVKVLKRMRESDGPAPKSAKYVEDSGEDDNSDDKEAPANFSSGQVDDVSMNIDPALSQVPPSAQKSTSAKKRTLAKERSKKTMIEEKEDPIEEVESFLMAHEAAMGEGLNNMEGPAEGKKKKQKKTPSKSKSKSMSHVQDDVRDSENMAPLRMSSDSEMDDMEDLPARMLSGVKAH